MSIYDMISIGIPAIISIAGFAITIYTLKKNFQNELVKQKANIQLDKMGSSEAIHILAAMQSENYRNAAMPENADKYRTMAFYVLLTVQIRADITGEIVSPEEWFRLKITDFQTNREMIKEANNRLVKEFRLDNRYIMR